MPATLDDALKLAIQLQSVETAQKRLHKEKRGSEGAVAVQQMDTAETSPSNAVYYRGSADANLKIQELTKEVQCLSDELAQMKGRDFRPRQQSDTTRRRPNEFSGSCWSWTHKKELSYTPRPWQRQTARDYPHCGECSYKQFNPSGQWAC